MILVTGATGFVGTHIVRRICQEGFEVRAFVRPTSDLSVLEGLSVEFVEGDITQKETLVDAVRGVEKVIHLVGIIRETPQATFKSIHIEGTRNILEVANEAGVRKFVHMSSLGTTANARSRYHQTKWLAEELVRSSGLPYVIFRPSIICGRGDEFVSLFARMMRRNPFVPVVGSGEYRLQPIFIDDVAHCFLKALTDESIRNELFELGGPEELTMNQILAKIAELKGYFRIHFHIPIFLMSPLTLVMEKIMTHPPVTPDQLLMLEQGNTCDITKMKQRFEFEPTRFEDALRTYLV